MSIQEELIQAAKKVLPDVACVIGWGEGPESVRHAPAKVLDEESANGLRAGFFSVNNPSAYIRMHSGKKIAVILKGCDSRSVGQLVSEGLVKREEIHIIGYGCEGVIDLEKLAAALRGKCELASVRSCREDASELVLDTPAGEIRFNKKDITADKCSRCMYPNTLDADTFVGEKREPAVMQDDYSDLAAFENMSLDERMDFWEKEMSRCIRCHACRSACPLCVCRNQCVSGCRDPHWVTQADGVRDKMFFQIIHATHLAGRCTGCGECERACPMGIPVLLLKRSLSRQVEQLFSYKAGVDTQGTPPLLTFTLEEPKIKERDW